MGGGLKKGRFPMQRETPGRQNKLLTVNCNGALSGLKSVCSIFQIFFKTYIYNIHFYNRVKIYIVIVLQVHIGGV